MAGTSGASLFGGDAVGISTGGASTTGILLTDNNTGGVAVSSFAGPVSLTAPVGLSIAAPSNGFTEYTADVLADLPASPSAPAFGYTQDGKIYFYASPSGPWTQIAPGGGGSFPTYTGSGTPEGVVTASPPDSYQDTTSGAIYSKASGSATNTGWVCVGGAGNNSSPAIAGIFESGSNGIGSVILQNAGSNANFLIDPSGNITAVGSSISLFSVVGNVSIDGSGNVTTSPSQTTDTATTALGQLVLGTALQNTTLSDLLVTVVIPVTASIGGFLVKGMDSTMTPTTDQASPALSAATNITITAWVPNNYYLLIDTSGTITCGTPITTAEPL